MYTDTIHLKDAFPVLGEQGRDPTLTVYVPDAVTWRLALGNNIDGYSDAHVNTKEDHLRPGILLCPGGGYGHLSGRESEPIALQFLSSGYRVFVLHYSCAPHRYPTQLIEVAAAMELIHQNASVWNCDTGKIAIMGFSAGGHLAAHYSTCYDCPEVRAVFPSSKAIQATILGYPVITTEYKGITFENLAGHELQTEEELRKFSCDQLVTDRTPPAFLWHTFLDDAASVVNTLRYAEALYRHRIPAEVHIYPYGPHGMATVDEETCTEIPSPVARASAWLNDVKAWLKMML